MKIQGSFDPFRIFSNIRSGRTEGEGGAGRNAYDPHQTRKDDQNQKDSSSEQQNGEDRGNRGQDTEALRQAVDAFHEDDVNRASGITAKIEGVAPGLVVVVSDVNGRRLRQFSGDEFMRLRNSAATDTRHRGKILDQKL